jgi:hypothetical protein
VSYSFQDQQCLESQWKRRSEVDLEQKNLKLTDSQNHSVGGSCSGRKEACYVSYSLHIHYYTNVCSFEPLSDFLSALNVHESSNWFF